MSYRDHEPTSEASYATANETYANPTPQRRRGIPAELETLERMDSEFADLLSRLESNLSAILAPPRPQDTQNKATGVVPVTPLVGDLQAAVQRRQRAAEHVRDLIDRLEI